MQYGPTFWIPPTSFSRKTEEINDILSTVFKLNIRFLNHTDTVKFLAIF